MKLAEFTILKRDACPVGKAHPISSRCKTIGSRFINPSASAGSQKNGFGLKKMEFACRKIIGHRSYTSLLINADREDIILRIEFHMVAKALIVKGIEDNSSCMVCRIAGPLHRLLPKIAGMASEVSLCDFSLRSAVEGDTHML